MNIAVIFAGGTGVRMGPSDKPKQFCSIMGKPIIVHTVEKFQNCSSIDCIVIACLADWIDYMRELVNIYNLSKVIQIVPGGKTGQESIYHGLLAAKEAAGAGDVVVLIHDGVRPMISSELIEENICSVHKYGTAITSANVTETPVITQDSSLISAVIPRANMRLAKAPQSFTLNALLELHEKALEIGRNDFMDSCELAQHFGIRCHFVECNSSNIKITTQEDMHLLWALLQAKDYNSNFTSGGDTR